MMLRLGMFAVFSTLVAIVTHLFFGSIIFAAAQQDVFAIVLRDAYKNETHYLSGMVTVPSECDVVSVHAKDMDMRTTAIVFETWEQSYRPLCNKIPTPRAVHVIAFGPERLEFRGMFDGEFAPLTIVPATQQ